MDDIRDRVEIVPLDNKRILYKAIPNAKSKHVTDFVKGQKEAKQNNFRHRLNNYDTVIKTEI